MAGNGGISSLSCSRSLSMSLSVSGAPSAAPVLVLIPYRSPRPGPPSLLAAGGACWGRAAAAGAVPGRRAERPSVTVGAEEGEVRRGTDRAALRFPRGAGLGDGQRRIV